VLRGLDGLQPLSASHLAGWAPRRPGAAPDIAVEPISAGSAATSGRAFVLACPWAGDSTVTGIEAFNLHLKRRWLLGGGGGSILSRWPSWSPEATRGFSEYPQPSRAFPRPAETNPAVSRLTRGADAFRELHPGWNSPKHAVGLLYAPCPPTQPRQPPAYPPRGEQQGLRVSAPVASAPRHHIWAQICSAERCFVTTSPFNSLNTSAGTLSQPTRLHGPPGTLLCPPHEQAHLHASVPLPANWAQREDGVLSQYIPGERGGERLPSASESGKSHAQAKPPLQKWARSQIFSFFCTRRWGTEALCCSATSGFGLGALKAALARRRQAVGDLISEGTHGAGVIPSGTSWNSRCSILCTQN